MATQAFQLAQAEPDTDEVFAQVNLLPESNFSEWLCHTLLFFLSNGEGLHGCHFSNRFVWLELQSTSFVADQKLPYLDFAGRRFRIRRLEDKKVIIVMTELSMLNAGISTQLLQTLFKVKGVIHNGIAGNADPQFEIGDVTIPQFWAHTGLWNWQSNRCQAKSENGNEESMPKSRICSEWS
ncbi:bark storage protein A [Pyrus ussuriensis x Pyrus communis]|uniref:Bark storage protein A n=1 Tax=Pyrus ussuriensis x Pyrus communis TaxID=2448454 RepID=A0A5N5HKL4_9ROSA|nr:bark storage protein A [Pyrus ussuriensis x Pyrus communis]